MMRVLMVEHWGKANPYAWNLALALGRQEVSLTLLCPEDWEGTTAERFSTLPILPCHGTSKSSLRKLAEYLRAYARAARLVREQRMRIVHFQYVRRFFIDTAYAAVLKARGVAIVYTAHNVLPHEPRFWHRPMFRLLYRLCDRVVATSRSAAAALTAEFGVPPSRIAHIPIGHCAPPGAQPPSPAAAREALGLQAGDRYVVALGQMLDYKGVDILLEAAGLIKDRVFGLKVFIGGEFPCRGLLEQYEESIRRLGLGGRVQILPRRLSDDEFLLHLAACDLVALPYRRASGHSAVLMHASLLAKPSVASRVAGLAEAVTHGETGFLVPPEDSQALAVSLEEAFSGPPSRLVEMGEQARRRLQNEFSWDRIAALTLALYHEIAADHRRNTRRS